jgi:hypothetical protein
LVKGGSERRVQRGLDAFDQNGAERVSDLGPGDLVHVECPCGHTELLTAAMLATAGVAPDRKVADLSRRMRCRECDELGRAVVSIRWA